MNRINRLLLAALLLLGLLIWWLQPTPLPPLTPLQAGQIERIRLLGKGREIDLRRHDGHWWLGDRPANEGRIQQLLGIARTPSLRRIPVAQGRLAEFGLASPSIRLWLDGLELQFGDSDPINGWRYVRIGDQIHLIGDGFRHHLLAPPTAYLQAP